MNLSFLAEALVQNGIAVEIWAGRGNPPKARSGSPTVSPLPSSSSSLITVKWIPTGRRRRFETSLFLHWRFLRGCGQARLAWRKKGESRPDLICANMAWPAGVAARALAKAYRIPLAIWHHGSDVHGGRRRGALWPQRVLLHWLWRSCAAVLFVSESLRSLASGYGPLPRAAKVPSMLDPALLAAARSARTREKAIPRPRESHSSGPSPFAYAVFLGRWEKVKEPGIAIAAMRHLRDWKCPLRLRVIGQGSLGKALRNQIKTLGLEDSVTLEAPATRAELPELFSQALALVLPSRAEGMSLTVLEAAAFGLPTIAADSPGLRESVKHGETGLLFPPGDAEALARHLAGLHADKSQREGLGARARDKAETFTPRAAAEAFLAATGSWLSASCREAA